MIGADQKTKRKASISEEDISLLLQKYTATTILALLQEVVQFAGVKIDWNALVKKTSTGISNAREYQMLWRHLAYHGTMVEKLEDDAEPLDDDSDLELELEPFPAVSAEASAEAAACVKVLIASGMPSESGPANRTTLEAPLTINIPNNQSVRAPSDNLQQARLTQGTNITVPVSVQKQPLPSGPSSEALDGNGPANANLPRKRKRRLWTEEEDMELIAAVQKFGEGNWANILKGDFKHDRTASQLAQRWANIRKRKPDLKPSNTRRSAGAAPTGSTLSEAQLAARQAVSMALNMPMMGGLSAACAAGTPQSSTPGDTSALPAIATEALTTPPPESSTVSPASTSSPALHQSQQASSSAVPLRTTPNPAPKSRASSKKHAFTAKHSTGPNPIIQAAAVAAGARIANPVTAASLFRAAQSKTAVHIRQGGSVPPSSLPGASKPLASGHIGSLPANVHYIRTGLASPPTVYSSKAQCVPRASGQNIQGGSGKLAGTGHPIPMGTLVQSTQPAQQASSETKSASHVCISPCGKAETKRKPSTSAANAGSPSADENKPDVSTEVPREPSQEQVALPKSNVGNAHAEANVANGNQAVIPRQTSLLNPSMGEKLIGLPSSDGGETQTSVNHKADKNQIVLEKIAGRSNGQANGNELVISKDSENQIFREKWTDLPNDQAGKNGVLVDGSGEDLCMSAKQTGLSSADASRNQTMGCKVAFEERIDSPKKEPLLDQSALNG